LRSPGLHQARDSVGHWHARSCFQKTSPPQRLPPGGPNNDICCGTACGRPSTNARGTRLVGAGCGSTPTPRRNSDDTPPWARGLTGRRADRTEDEKGRGGIVVLQVSAARKHLVAVAIYLPSIATFMPSRPRDAHHASPVAQRRLDALRRRSDPGTTQGVDLASSGYCRLAAAAQRQATLR
jgi:hypothetical protein